MFGGYFDGPGGLPGGELKIARGNQPTNENRFGVQRGFQGHPDNVGRQQQPEPSPDENREDSYTG